MPDRGPRGVRGTPAAGRCTWSAGASAGSSRCSPPPTSPTCRSPRCRCSARRSTSTLVPLVAPLRPLLRPTDWPGPITRAYRALGGAPTPLVRWAFQLTSFQKLVTKPIAVAVHLDDADWLAQVEAVDRFTAAMTAYPGRSFGQLYHRFAKGNALATGHRRARRPRRCRCPRSPRRRWSSPAPATASPRSPPSAPCCRC